MTSQRKPRSIWPTANSWSPSRSASRSIPRRTPGPSSSRPIFKQLSRPHGWLEGTTLEGAQADRVGAAAASGERVNKNSAILGSPAANPNWREPGQRRELRHLGRLPFRPPCHPRRRPGKMAQKSVSPVKALSVRLGGVCAPTATQHAGSLRCPLPRSRQEERRAKAVAAPARGFEMTPERRIRVADFRPGPVGYRSTPPETHSPTALDLADLSGSRRPGSANLEELHSADQHAGRRRRTSTNISRANLFDIRRYVGCRRPLPAWGSLRAWPRKPPHQRCFRVADMPS